MVGNDDITQDLIEDDEKKTRDTVSEIPHLLRLAENLGTRIKLLDDKLVLMDRAVNAIQGYASEEGSRRLKRETYNYVVQHIREHILTMPNGAVSKDLLHIFCAKILQKGEKDGANRANKKL